MTSANSGKFLDDLGTFWSDFGMQNHNVLKQVELEFPKSHPSVQFL